MRFAWCIVSCLLILLVITDGKGPKVDPNSLCPRIEDIEGNCKDDGLKRVRSICRQLITVTILIAHVTTST
uniref:Hydrophobic seed protein domain-containing protein n=1 Tax=Brassica campestris TaxID=3711 RepID=A0A3P5ZNB7_BRACM|nr:unnamed protein product [Brassica rapa]